MNSIQKRINQLDLVTKEKTEYTEEYFWHWTNGFIRRYQVVVPGRGGVDYIMITPKGKSFLEKNIGN